MWCVIQVKGSQELQIQKQLELAGYQALVPRESRLIRSGGAWMQREYILFPNYVFVETEFEAEDFYKIKGINVLITKLIANTVFKLNCTHN